jgi:glutathione S-transferase
VGDAVQVIGSYLSPYVRKVLVCLDLKGIRYEIDPIVPFFGDERFTALSPLRRVPVLIDADVVLSDSTVVCEYLEERTPRPPLLPDGAGARARARWLEEFADTRMGEVFIWGLFNQLLIKPFVWREETDQAAVRKTLDEDVPHVLDYLESQVPADGFVFGPVSLADIAIACFFRNASFARFAIDAARWPKAAAFVERVLALDSFQKLNPFEERMMRTPIPQHRSALAEIGAPLMRETYGTTATQRGILRS